MDLHNISVGDIVINSIGEEAKVTRVMFSSNDVHLYFNGYLTGWIGGDSDYDWYYHYDGKFVKSEENSRPVANIVKVIKHD